MASLSSPQSWPFSSKHSSNLLLETFKLEENMKKKNAHKHLIDFKLFRFCAKHISYIQTGLDLFCFLFIKFTHTLCDFALKPLKSFNFSFISRKRDVCIEIFAVLLLAKIVAIYVAFVCKFFVPKNMVTWLCHVFLRLWWYPYRTMLSIDILNICLFSFFADNDGFSESNMDFSHFPVVSLFVW